MEEFSSTAAQADDLAFYTALLLHISVLAQFSNNIIVLFYEGLIP